MTKGRGMLAWAAAALMPLAAACSPGMGGMGAMSGAGQADVAAHAFVSAVDAGEIQQGQLAQSRAQNPQVRSFAQRMVADHSGALQMREQRLGAMGMGLRAGTRTMAGGEGMSAGGGASMGSGSGNGMFTSAMVTTPSGMSDLNAVLMANPHSRPVAETAMRDMQMLQQLSGAAFDRAYMTRQAEMHQFTLDSLDRLLAQNAMSADMRAMLTTQRGAVAMHLQMAQQLRGQL